MEYVVATLGRKLNTMTQQNTQPNQAEITENSETSRRLSLKEQKAALEERHKKELAQLKAKIKIEEQRQKVKERKEDARRKIIAGALALHHMEKNKNTEFEIILSRLLNEYVVKDSERALFGLPPLPADEQKQRLERHAQERKKESAFADA
jgi:hypothetical protein